MRLALAAVAAAAAVALVVGVRCGGDGRSAQVDPDPLYGSQPNFVFILADDMNLRQFNRRYMRRTRKLIADPGTEFTNYYAVTPLCCPSRAAMLTGQYGHNNGVMSNVPGYGTLRGAREHPAGVAAARRLPDGRGGQMAERLREDRGQAPGGAAGVGQVARPRRRPRLLPLQGLQQRQEGQVPQDLPHRLDRGHLDRPDRQALLRRRAVLPPGQRVRASRRELPLRERRPLRRRGRPRAAGPASVRGHRPARHAVGERARHHRQAHVRLRQGASSPRSSSRSWRCATSAGWARCAASIVRSGGSWRRSSSRASSTTPSSSSRRTTARSTASTGFPAARGWPTRRRRTCRWRCWCPSSTAAATRRSPRSTSGRRTSIWCRRSSTSPEPRPAARSRPAG